uniref:Uncharacterized protein n=1 Tax=viral metagenome TaxID=1070528 RepID=A0A6C0HT16_9ZZZZ
MPPKSKTKLKTKPAKSRRNPKPSLPPSLSRQEIMAFTSAAQQNPQTSTRSRIATGSRIATLFENFNIGKRNKPGKFDISTILDKLVSKEYTAKKALTDFLNEELNVEHDTLLGKVNLIVQIPHKGLDMADYTHLTPRDLGNLELYGCTPDYDDVDGQLYSLYCFFDFSNAQMEFTVEGVSHRNVLTKLDNVCKLFKDFTDSQKN